MIIAPRSGQLVLLALAVWAELFVRDALGSLQETMRIALGVGDNEMALLQGPAIAVPTAIAALPLGLLIDRYSRVRLLQLSLVLMFVGSAVAAFAPTFAALFAARCFLGIVSTAPLIIGISLVADLYEPASRGRAIGLLLIAATTGAASAFGMGGVLLTQFDGENGWRWTLLAMAGALVPVLAATLMLREPPRTGVVEKNPPLGITLAQLWGYRAVVVPLLAARLLVAVADSAAIKWVAPVFQRGFDVNPDRIGMIVAGTMMVGGLSSALLGGLLADWCQRSGGPPRTVGMLSVLVLLSLPAGLFAVAPEVITASILFAAFLIMGLIVGTAWVTLSTIVVPNELRGLYLALAFGGGNLIAGGLAPLMVSSLSGVLGGPLMIGKALAMVCSVASVLAAIVLLFGWQFVRSYTDSGIRAVSQG